MKTLRSSLLITVCPTNYKDPPIYRGLRTPLLQNYTFFSPDGQLYTLFKGITVTKALYGNSNVSSHGRSSFHVAPFISPSYGAALHLRSANVSLYACLSDKQGPTDRLPLRCQRVKGTPRSFGSSSASSPSSVFRHLQPSHVPFK
jgi:hypothetical protein